MKKTAPPAAGGGSKKRKLKREELAVLLSVVATVVVIVQRFLTDNDLLLLPSQTMALEASVQATTLALTKLHMMFSITGAVSLVENDDEEKRRDDVGPSSGSSLDRDRNRDRDMANCWFSRFTSSITDDRTWREHFRMSKRTFTALLDSLHPALDHSGVSGAEEEEPRPSPPPYNKLGAALYRLAHGATFKSVGRKFGMGTASACKAFYQVCGAMQDRLYHLSEFPSTAESLFAVIDGFSSMDMPNCCGVIGYTRFLLDAPPAAHPADDYRDPHGRHGVIMQGLVDSRGRFLDISVGWPGSDTPPRILPRTQLYARVEDTRELLHGPPAELINGVLMPQYIIGDTSCPLYSWLLTPYLADALPPLTPTQELYNSVHDYARRAISRAFGTLKSQWQLLTTQQRWKNVEFLSRIVIAACVLQNFLINSEEPQPDVQEVIADDFAVAVERNEFGESIRDALAAHIGMVAQIRAQL